MIRITNRINGKLIYDYADNNRSLKGLDLSFADLRGFDLRQFDLRGTNFYCADLTDANVSSANCYQANFTNANLERTNFTCTMLDRATFTKTTAPRAIFNCASMCSTSITDADFEHSSFIGAKMLAINCNSTWFTKSDLTGADLRYGRYMNSDMMGALLIGTNLIDTDISTSLLKDSDMRGAILDDGWICISHSERICNVGATSDTFDKFQCTQGRYVRFRSFRGALTDFWSKCNTATQRELDTAGRDQRNRGFSLPLLRFEIIATRDT